MRYLNKILTGAVLFVLTHQYAPACTGFVIKDGKQVLAGLSYDHQFGAGYIYVNQRNVERQRYLLYAEKPVPWVSKYGSVTFNLAGRDYPHDGMNEAGLVVLSMGLDDTRFPGPDSRPAIDELGWIQYQLDTAASVDEVIQSLKSIRISSRGIGDSHYLVVDSSGKAVVIEYPGGQAKMYTGADLPYAILANDTYPHMLAYLKQQKTFGGPNEDKYRVGSSCCRFTQVADDIRKYNPANGPITDCALGILSEVRQRNSRYQVVYDISNRRIQYRSFNSRDLKTIELGEVDFDCHKPALMTAIQSTNTGNLRGKFYEYDSQRSRAALAEFNREALDGFLPEEALIALAETPHLSRCRDTETRTGGDASLKDLAVALKGPAESSIVVSNGASNVILNLEVNLNRPASNDMDFALEVPPDSGLVPGKHIFIAPNPIRIGKGRRSADAKVMIIADHLKAGAKARLVVNLLSTEMPLGSQQQFVIDVKRETASK